MALTTDILFIALSLAALSGCGNNNIFAAAEKKDVAEQAAIYLEKDRPAKAQAILEKALESEPNNYKLHSLLSAALAQIFDVDPVTIALRLSQPKEGGSAGSSNGIESMFDALPDATDTAIAGTAESLGHLEIIPVDQRTRADNFLLSILHSAYLALKTKKLDINRDGKVTPDELVQLSNGDAASIISSLIASQAALSTGNLGGDGADASSEKISAIREAIAKQEGANDSERLRNYLGKR